MKTGASYMGCHSPRHLLTDIRDMTQLGIDDVLLAIQENDFAYFTGKIRFTPRIAKDHGLRPLAVFWGALNLFGGGRSSQFLLDHPEGFQVTLDGAHLPQGCYVNPACVGRIKEMIDAVADSGFEGYFVDEPTPLRNCFCKSCRRRFEDWYGADLARAPDERQEEFRRRCCIEYVRTICDYCKTAHPGLETLCCVMPCDEALWETMAALPGLDNLGTDIYWTNNDRNVEEMVPLVRRMAATCRTHRKQHHEWLQCWDVRRGCEERVLQQGKVLVHEKPDALYIWAWEGQTGVAETCDDPVRAWAKACEVLALAKR